MKTFLNFTLTKACFVLCIFCFFLSGCATTSSAKAPNFYLDRQCGVYKATAIPYGNDSKQKLDIYLPENYMEQESLDILVFIHGGAYYTGSRYELKDSCTEMARNGLVVAMMDYRLVGANNDYFFKEMFEDVCTSVEKITAVCAAKNIKLDKAAIMGTSAGAHLAMLYAYKMIDQSPLDIAFCINYVGPADLADPNFLAKEDDKRFEGLMALIKKRLGVTKGAEAVPYFKEYSPIEYLKPTSVPTICAYAKNDEIVPFSICESLIAKFEELGCTYTLTVFPQSNHDLSAPEDAPLREVVLSYIDEYMEKYF